METENKDTVNVEKTEVEETEEVGATKTYTQEDLDNSFNAGRKKASQDWKKDEKYKEFMEWKKTNQNDSEKISELTTQNEQLIKKVNMLEAKEKVMKSDVKPEFLKFVTSEVLSLVNDTTDFDSALKNFKKDNSQYFGEVVVKKVQSSPSLGQGGNKETTTSSIMNDILRSSRN